MEENVHRLIYLARNLKALYLPSGDVRRTEDEVKDLGRRFRYRRVGVIPGVLEEDMLRPPLTEIGVDPPFRFEGLRWPASETLAMASLFMAPVIASPAWRDELSDLMMYEIRLKRPLTRREFQFNLRLLTYIPVDLADGSPPGDRRAYILADCEKRFWRFREETGEGDLRLGVIDPQEHVASPEWMLNPVGVIFLE